MAEITKRDAEEELRRRGILTGGTRSVLAQPEETTSLEEVRRFTEALLKGSAKGIVDLVGGYGNLYDYIKKNPEPSGLSSRGIVNAISNLGGPDLMKLQGYKGAYDIGQAGAPAALMGAAMPAGSLFSGTTGTAARAAKEFGAAGTIGLLSQQVAPESPYAQLTLQTLPYLVKGGVSGWKERKQQSLLNEYKALLPEKDLGIFNEFVLKGQGSTDPAIAADIARLTRSPKYLEMVTALNEGATAKALEGMAPKGSQLTPEQAKTGIIQAVQNKLAGIRESNADSLFEKAKGYGAGNGLVDPTQTLGKIDELIGRYSKQATPNAERAVQVLQSIRERLQPTQSAVYGAQPSSSFVVREGTAGFTAPSQPGGVRIVERQVPTFDSLGTPTGTRTVREEVPFSGEPSRSYAGTPATMGTNPASAGKTINYQNAPQKLTVEEVQGLLSEFGKKASAGDNLIKDLSISDERIISSAIFGGMKDDVAAALKGTKGADKAALELLKEARTRVSDASTAYNEAISQGMPAFLQNKSLAEISPEDLYSTYKNLTPAQRGTMREWVGTTDQAALDVLDKQVFSEFVNQAKKTNNLGVETVDLATLAKNWRELANVPGAQDSLVTALGTNSTEFGQRMKDAELFTRKMSVTQGAPDQAFTPAQVRETQAAIGGVAGYGPAKIGQLAMDSLNTLTNNGLSEEQLMKVLLTDSGKNFLKSASLSPRSEKALTDLMSVDQTPLEALGKWGMGTVARTGPRIGSADQPVMVAPEAQLQQEPQQQQQEAMPQISREQAIEELKARGIAVE
jgi:hypothetical protein